jgi:hypothetical protein
VDLIEDTEDIIEEDKSVFLKAVGAPERHRRRRACEIVLKI